MDRTVTVRMNTAPRMAGQSESWLTLIDELTIDTEWQTAAACNNYPDEWFVPDGQGWRETNALAVCADCPVIDDCYDFAIEYDCIGVWGGTVFPAAAKLRKERLRPRSGMPRHGSEGRYRLGCRCDTCLAENLARAKAFDGQYSKRWTKHATNAGYTAGCRCFACKEAHNEYVREYRARKKAGAA